MASSPFQPVQSSVAAALWAALTAVLILPLSLVLFMQVIPPEVWHPWRDEWYTLSLGSGVELLRAQGYTPPLGPLGWMAAPHVYLQRTWPVLTAAEHVMPVLIHLAVALAVAAGPAGHVFRRVRAVEPKIVPAEHVSGPRPLWRAAGLTHLHERFADERRQTGAGVMLAPGLHLSRRAELGHLFAVGTPGSGKTVIVEGLMAQAIARGDRVFALDVKGDLPRRLARHRPRCLRLNGENASVWAIGRDLRSPEDSDEFAACLIPDSHDPVWGQGSRLILSALVERLRAEHGTDWGWRKLQAVLSLPFASLERLIQPQVPLIAQLLGGREEPPAFVLSLLMNMAAHVTRTAERFAAMEKRGARPLSIRDWARGATTRFPVVLRFDLQRRDASGAFVRLILRILSGALLSDDASDEVDHGVWLFLDELTRAGRTDAVLDLASLGRSRGIRCVVTAQSPAQVTEVYGPAGAEGFLGNFKIWIVGQLPPGETAKRVAEDWIGTRTLREPAGRVQPGQSPREQERPVLSPGEIVSELGLRYDLLGRPVIRAVVLGSGDVPVLDWALHRWPKLA